MLLMGSTAVFSQGKQTVAVSPTKRTSAADTSMTGRVHQLNPVVVTGTGTYRRADNSPVAVRVLTAKELRDAQVTTLADALQRLTSNITTHTNGMGTFVNFNGVSDDYVVILENGHRISGDDRWNRLSMENVKRIEVFSGAASTLYGSDALAGVINIITDDSQKPVNITANSRLASKGRQQQNLVVDATAGTVSSHTAYTHSQADNWQVNHYQAFDEGGTEVLKLTGRPMSVGYQSHNISEKLEWRLTEAWSFYVRGSYYDYLTARPQGATYATQKKTTDKTTGNVTYTYSDKAAYTYDLHHKSYTYGGGARWVPDSRTHLYLDVYSDNFQSDYDYWQTAAKEAYDETRKRTHYVNETLKGIFRLTSWNKLSAGVEAVQESLTSQSDNIGFETTNTYNVFAQDELQLCPWLEAVAGVRYTYNDNFGSAVTPSAGLFLHRGGFRLRANYAAGYRTPTLSQLYATDQAKTASRYTLYNPNLKAEKNHFFTVNAEYGNHWVTVSVSAFMNKIRDMINYRTMSTAEVEGDAALKALQQEGWTTIRQRDNIDRATLKGISASLKLLLPGGFSVGGGYTLTDSKAETRTLDTKTQQYVVTESDVDKSVRHVGNVSAAWDHTWKNYHLNVSIDGHMQGRRYSSTYGYADGISQWNVSTRHSVRLRQLTLEPGLAVENVLNKRDTAPWNSNFATINPGRSLVASLRLTY